MLRTKESVGHLQGTAATQIHCREQLIEILQANYCPMKVDVDAVVCGVVRGSSQTIFAKVFTLAQRPSSLQHLGGILIADRY